MVLKDVVIPAAGLGTRMFPITQGKISKLMLNLRGKPIIDYAIEEAVNSKLKEIHVIVHNKQSDLYKHLSESQFSNNLNFVEQKELNGVTNAILKAEDYITGNFFAIIYPDILFISDTPAISQLISYHSSIQNNLFGYVNLNPSELKYISTSNYLITDNINNLTKVTDIILTANSKNPKKIKFPFRSVYSKEFFELAKSLNKKQYSDADVLASLIKNLNIYCKKLNGKIYDTGNPEGFLKAQNNL